MILKQRFARVSTVRLIALIFLTCGLIVGVLGYINQNCFTIFCSILPNPGEIFNGLVRDFYTNITIDLMSSGTALLIADIVDDLRTKQQLIREMGSIDNGIALRAVNELRAHGWLQDKSLVGIKLREANLQGASLTDANLEDADFFNANLQKTYFIKANLKNADLLLAKVKDAVFYNADLTNAKGLLPTDFLTMSVLKNAIMPDGRRYDGRYNLKLDLSSAQSQGVDRSDPEAMARYYEIPLEDYLASQQWFHKNVAPVVVQSPLEQEQGETTTVTDEHAPLEYTVSPIAYAVDRLLNLWRKRSK